MRTNLHILRLKFFRFLITVLLLAGYSEVLRGVCSFEPESAACVDGDSNHSHSDSEHEDAAACQCLCHQTYFSEQPTARLAPVLLAVISLVLERADHPPDPVPLGIDHPPQLA